MDINLILLNNKIEYLRENLQTLLTYNSPTSALVVECSQNLDKLLIEYEKYELKTA